MQPTAHLTFAARLLDICGSDKGATIYSLLPLVDSSEAHLKGVYGHVLENQPSMIDSAVEIFTKKKNDIARGSFEFKRLQEEEKNFMQMAGDMIQLTGEKGAVKISSDKISAALSALSHIYLDTFLRPIQFFLPHSSACSGQWGFWDKIDYFKLKERFNDKNFVISFAKELAKKELWSIDMKPDDFPLIVKRRLLKENAFGKKLDSAAMIKALIIRIGEMAKPDINYEVTDYSIRSFFTYLGVKQYLRVDREIEFLRRLEDKLKNAITAGL